MNDTSSRAALRRAMRERRRQLTAAHRLDAAARLGRVLEDLPELLTDTTFAGYWAVAGELSLHAVVPGFARREQTYCLPVLVEDPLGHLRFAPWYPGVAIAPNRYGIPEPAAAGQPLLAPDAIQCVFVPLVAFDRRGNRLGSGAGYYDRTFAFLRERERPTEPLLVGVGYAFQEVAALDAAAWDVPLDLVATERELIDCSPRRAE